MKKIIVFCLIFTFVQNIAYANVTHTFINMNGMISSSHSREPQVIKLHREDDRLYYLFCLSSKADDCEILGSNEGYSTEKLEALSNYFISESDRVALENPLVDIGIVLGSILAFKFTASTFVLSSVFTGATLEVNARRNDFSNQDDHYYLLGTMAKEKASKVHLYIDKGISIVDFADDFDKKLLKLEKCIFENKTFNCQNLVVKRFLEKEMYIK